MQNPEFLNYTMQQTNMVWEFTTTDGKTQYLLAPDLEEAAWIAQKLSNGKLKDVRLSDEQ